MMNFPSYYDAQRGIPGGTDAYDYLQATIRKMEALVTSLNEFHSMAIGLDANHQDQVVALRDTLMSLYTNTPFQGAGADALFTLLLDYLDREHAFTGFPGDTSPQLAQATSLCQTTASSINDQLRTLYNEAEQFAYQVDMARPVNPLLRPARRLLDPHFPSDAVIDASCDLPPSTPMRVETMDMDEVSWGNQMDTLGGQPLPQLPQVPSDPKFIIPPMTPLTLNPLTPDQQRVANDAIATLTRDGIYFDQAEVEDLARAGYSSDAIIAIIKLGTISGSHGKYYYTRSGYPYSAHGEQHIGASVADMIARTQKSKTNGGAPRMTTFYGEISAQDAISWAIAGDPAAQAFIQAAVPNTNMQISRCAPAGEHKDWGFGYKRQDPSGGSYPPPILHEHLSCVTVWIAIDPYGNPFIVDAYPTW